MSFPTLKGAGGKCLKDVEVIISRVPSSKTTDNFDEACWSNYALKTETETALKVGFKNSFPMWVFIQFVLSKRPFHSYTMSIDS